MGIIEKSLNAGQIGNSSEGVYVYSGGICGMSQNGSTVRTSYNKGDISNEGKVLYTTGSCQTAGIVASNSGEIECVIENCYNTGMITNEAIGTCGMGGIASNNSSYSRIRNSYNTGKLVSDIEDIRGGAIAGNATNQTITNCYYLLGSYSKGTNNGELGTKSETESDMKSNAFIDLLQADQTEEVWKLDEGINNGYPILSWQ